MERIMIIAEAGVNHNGDLRTALQMVEVAKKAGADAIKFQLFEADNLTLKTAKKARYQLEGTGKDDSQYDMLKGVALKKQDYEKIYKYCKDINILCMASAFDLDSLDFLNSLGTDIIKIPSGEITNLLYLEKIASFHKKVILSTGMASLREIKEALEILENPNQNQEDIILLHCISAYPASVNEVNLKAMQTLKAIFHKNTGLSDHTLGIEIAIAAAALDACVIEKHFTLNKDQQGPDHKMSLDPVELKTMVTAVRNVEKAMGNGVKELVDVEKENKKFVRKSLVAIKDIRKGEIYTLENLGAKRPGDGISPMRIKQLLGQKSNRYYKVDDQIKEFL